MNFRRIAIIAAAISGSMSAAAPAQAQRINLPANRWMVEHGTYGCSMARRIGGPQSPILMVRSYPGQRTPEVSLLRDGSERLPNLPGRVDVVLGSDGPREPVRIVEIGSGADHILRVEDVAADFFERFATAETVSFGDLTIRLPRLAPAIAAVRACHDTLLTTWGVDVAALATYSRQATMTDGSIGWQDYPREAVNARDQGRVVVRLAVGTDGAVETCDVVASSRVPALDGATCRIARSRFRFTPALDAGGTAVQSTYVQSVSWVLR